MPVNAVTDTVIRDRSNPGRSTRGIARTISASAPLDAELDGRDTVAETLRPKNQKLALSFEVMPPRNEAQKARMPALLESIQGYDPDYLAVTSAMGTGWARGTADFIELISSTTDLKPLAHMACTAAPVEELTVWIEEFIDAGVRGFLALRGDLEPGAVSTPEGHLDHANELVGLLREVERRNVARLCAGRLAIGVAAYPSGHPESASRDHDIDVLAAKQRNGADFSITQLFFDGEHYRRLLADVALAGITLPVIPGIMPVTSLKRLTRMCSLSGLEPPADLVRRLEAARTDAEEYRIGLDFTADLVRDILPVTPGLHFYTFNNPQTVADLVSLL